MFPGERQAIHEIKRLGAAYGYGNLIRHLKDAWSDMLVEKSGLDRETADQAAGHICVWCKVDHRTGKRASLDEKGGG